MFQIFQQKNMPFVPDLLGHYQFLTIRFAGSREPVSSFNLSALNF